MKPSLTAILLALALPLCGQEAHIVVFGSGSQTAKALEAMNVPAAVFNWGDFARGDVNLFDFEIIICGMDARRSTLADRADATRAFVTSGGVLVGMRTSEEDKWLPSPVKLDKAYQFGDVLQPEHPLFNAPHKFDAARMKKVHGGSIYRAFHDLGKGWTPLVATGAEQGWDETAARSKGAHYGIIEMKHGKGRILLCQMIPDYAFVHDAKLADCDGKAFLENLLAYVRSVAPDWAKHRKPRRAPDNFKRDLNDLLRPPTGAGTLPMTDAAWKVESAGSYSGKADRRGVYTIGAGDVPAKKGSFGEVSRALEAGDGEGAYLRFYSSDDYCGGNDPTMEGDRRVKSTPNFKQGVRFKQVLVNGEMVWQQDVLGRNELPAHRRFHTVFVPARILRRADPATVSLRVVDVADTPEDEPFATDTYWAGVEVMTGIMRFPARRLAGPGFKVSRGGLSLGADAGTLVLPFDGAAGKYAIAVHLRDEHTGQSQLAISVGEASVMGCVVSADDFSWWWATAVDVALKPGDIVHVDIRKDGNEACLVDEVAFVPMRHVAQEALEAQEAAESPLYRPGDPVKRGSVALTVTEPAGVDRANEIATQGVPFPYGALADVTNVRVLDSAGGELPHQARVLARWPDESIKWALVGFPVSVGAGESNSYTLDYGSGRSRSGERSYGAAPITGAAVTVADEGAVISINTGVLQTAVSKATGALFEEVTLKGKEVKSAEDEWGVLIEKDGKVFSSGTDSVTSCEVLEAGPLRAIVRRIGRHTAEDGSTFCEYDMRQEFFAGSGVTKLRYTFTHKEDSNKETLRRVTVDMPWAVPEGKRVLMAQFTGFPGAFGGPALGGIIEKRTQKTADEQAMTWILGPDDELTISRTADDGKRDLWELKGPTQHELAGPGRLLGWTRMRVGDLGFDVACRWFWQMYPKAVSQSRAGVELDLKADVEDDPFVLYQGEAIWHEALIRFAQDAPESEDKPSQDTSAFKAFEQPLRAVVDPHYVAASLALGQWAPAMPRVFPEWEQGAERAYKGVLATREKRKEYGIDNFGDATFEWGYGPSYTFWRNQEYDRHHGLLLQHLRSGDYGYWEIGEQAARQYRDIVCYHWAPGREYLIGAPHPHNSKHIVEEGWVSDHCLRSPSNGHSWVEGLITYYFLTGDVRAKETFEQMGDWYVWTVENNRYGAGGQERGPGWTLIALAGLYNATYDEKYKDAMGKIMDWVESVQDPVRGVVSIPISEQPSYEGGSSFMHGILGRGLARYYEATGDPRGKAAVIGIANWITSESMGPPGMFYYKQAPRIKGRYRYGGSQEFSALSYAFQYTGDALFGEIAKVCCDHNGPGLSMAWLPCSLHHVIPLFTPVRTRVDRAKVFVTPNKPGTVSIALTNCSDEAVAVSVRVEGVPKIVTAQVKPERVELAPDAEAEVLITFVVAAPVVSQQTEARVVITAGEQAQRIPLSIRTLESIVEIEAPLAAGEVTGPMVVGDYAEVPRDEDFSGNPWPPGSDHGTIKWTLDIPTAGLYFLSGDCWWEDDKGNSFHARVDDEDDRVFGNDAKMHAWHWTGPAEGFELTAGKHELTLSGREEGARLRKLVLSNVAPEG